MERLPMALLAQRRPKMIQERHDFTPRRRMSLIMLSSICATTSLCRERSSRQVSIHLLQPAFAKLTGADDVEGQRIQIGQIGMIQHKADILHRKRFPGVQADQDVAALNAGLGSCGSAS